MSRRSLIACGCCSAWKVTRSRSHRVTPPPAPRLSGCPFDLVLTDLQLPDDRQGGLSLLRAVKERAPDTEVIVITGHGTYSEAVEATKAGAYYFVEKPFEGDQILLLADKALERRRLVSESESFRRHIQRREYSSIIGASKAMQMIYETIESIAKSDANVLIIGESGTGKELIANALHFNSLRAEKEFVKVNCSALPKELIEAELFGYVKGAFTGAIQNRQGLIAQAKGGSLMLDEIGEMPMELQPKLLRVLEERQFRPVGSTETFEADFRLICATNREPREAIKEGMMREDLFYRVSTITINVPPLRERAEDLQLLTDYFFQKFKDKYNRPATGLFASRLSTGIFAPLAGQCARIAERHRTRGSAGERPAALSPKTCPSETYPRTPWQIRSTSRRT